jgi:hypothetical protein
MPPAPTASPKTSHMDLSHPSRKMWSSRRVPTPPFSANPATFCQGICTSLLGPAIMMTQCRLQPRRTRYPWRPGSSRWDWTKCRLVATPGAAKDLGTRWDASKVTSDSATQGFGERGFVIKMSASCQTSLKVMLAEFSRLGRSRSCIRWKCAFMRCREWWC